MLETVYVSTVCPYTNPGIRVLVLTRAIFESATAFNQPLNNWNVPLALILRYSFAYASSLNQRVSNLPRSSISVSDNTGEFSGDEVITVHNLNPSLGHASVDTEVIGSAVPTYSIGFYANPGYYCLLYTSPSPRDRTRSRMPSSA